MTEPQVGEVTDVPPEDNIGVPLFTPAEAARKVAATEKIARLTLGAIIILTVLGVIGVVVLFILDKPDGATAILTLLTPTVAGLLAYRKGSENAKSIQELHLSVDGRLTQLLRKTDATARAEGTADGLAAQRTRRDDTSNDSTASISSGLTTEEGTKP